MSVRISAAFLGVIALAWMPTAGAFAVDACATGKHIPANDPACTAPGAASGDAKSLTVRKAGEKPVEYLKAPVGAQNGPTGTITNNGMINDKR